jgi:two-component system LytT family response regulator
MVKTVILDDEERGLNVLDHLCRLCKNIELVGKFTDPEEAIHHINQMRPQLIILDINMPKYNGFEVLKQINYQDFKTIFVTAYNEFAIKAFQYSASNYLLKPVDDDLFFSAIDDITKSIESKSMNDSLHTLMHNLQHMYHPLSMKISIPNMNGYTVVDTKEILYCEADSCYTVFRFVNGDQLLSSRTLAEYETILNPQLFVRIHRSYIINMACIKEIKKIGSVVMLNGKELEISRRKKEEVLLIFKELYRVK